MGSTLMKLSIKGRLEKMQVTHGQPWDGVVCTVKCLLDSSSKKGLFLSCWECLWPSIALSPFRDCLSCREWPYPKSHPLQQLTHMGYTGLTILVQHWRTTVAPHGGDKAVSECHCSLTPPSAYLCSRLDFHRVDLKGLSQTFYTLNSISESTSSGLMHWDSPILRWE